MRAASERELGRQLRDLFGEHTDCEGPLSPSGAGLRLTGVDLRPRLTPEQVTFLLDALSRFGVVTMPGQDLETFSLAHFERFANHWGAPIPHPNNFTRGGKMAQSDGASDGLIEWLPFERRRAAAVNASEIYLGSFVVAQATVEAIKKDGPELVSIIAMGDQAVVRTDEDEHCGIYLRNILEGRKPDFDAVRTLILAGGATQKFFDPRQPQYHPEDVTLALEADRYSFAMKISREDGLLVARKHDL